MTFAEIKDILKEKAVGIAGCGGLGSNIAVALARVGVGKLIIADFDVIVESNLNRQYFFLNQIGEKKAFALKENINKINPSVIVEAHDLKLNENNIIDLYANCDLLVEAFDRSDMKVMIIETALTTWHDRALIVGSGMAGWGNNKAISQRQLGNLYICGDEKTEVSENLPPLAPRVGIVANMMANTVLDLLLPNN